MQEFVIKCSAKNLGEKITEHFKSKLNECIETNGRTSLIAVRESQELDKLVVKEQLKRVNYGC